MRCTKLIGILILVIMLISSCGDESASIDYQPVAEFVVSPDSGNTTTIFQFDAAPALAPSLEDNPVFLRWDWDADGEWDKMYTSGGNYTHRFFKKGTYTILLEAATLLGRKDTTRITLVINQGYSPPHPDFIISPDSANIFTEFVFDASASKDDEDSLNQLQFRWDFEGDEIWDTEFSSEPIVKHIYEENSDYIVKMELRDPDEMSAIASFQLEVTRLNDQIEPHMTTECWPCTMEDTIHFDAGESFIKDDPEGQLLYSLDIFNDNIWEFKNSESSIFEYRIPSEGKHKVKLRVTDKDGLYMDSVYIVEIFPFNTAPKALLVLGNRYGNTSTNFYVHGRGSYDRESSYLDLKIKWDMNDDGQWDVEHNDKFEAWLKFDEPGKYPIAFNLTDTQDKSITVYDTITVFPGNHTTDLVEDRRENYIPEYYGAVLIGNTWWTQRNSIYKPPEKALGTYPVNAYKNEYDSISKYGYLYPYSALNSKFSPCPDGWRIPSLEDWEQLMTDLEPNNSISDLLLGGYSELHLKLTGQKEFGDYDGKGRMVHYYTTSSTPQGHVYLWYIDNLLKKNKSVLAGRYYSLPVRCIKNN